MKIYVRKIMVKNAVKVGWVLAFCNLNQGRNQITSCRLFNLYHP